MSQPMNQETSPAKTKHSRVDQVGSLLRPQALKDAYARHGNGEIGDAELTRIQDESVKELIPKQETHGLSILTDGEYRRLNFQDSFVESVAGFIPKKQTMQFLPDRGARHLERLPPRVRCRRRGAGPAARDAAQGRRRACGRPSLGVGGREPGRDQRRDAAERDAGPSPPTLFLSWWRPPTRRPSRRRRTRAGSRSRCRAPRWGTARCRARRARVRRRARRRSRSIGVIQSQTPSRGRSSSGRRDAMRRPMIVTGRRPRLSARRPPGPRR